jgi:hypothetical protein
MIANFARRYFLLCAKVICHETVMTRDRSSHIMARHGEKRLHPAAQAREKWSFVWGGESQRERDPASGR